MFNWFSLNSHDWVITCSKLMKNLCSFRRNSAWNWSLLIQNKTERKQFVKGLSAIPKQLHAQTRARARAQPLKQRSKSSSRNANNNNNNRLKKHTHTRTRIERLIRNTFYWKCGQNGINVCARILLKLNRCSSVHDVCRVRVRKRNQHAALLHATSWRNRSNDEQRRRYKLNCIVCGILCPILFAFVSYLIFPFSTFSLCCWWVWIVFKHTHTFTSQIFP